MVVEVDVMREVDAMQGAAMMMEDVVGTIEAEVVEVDVGTRPECLLRAPITHIRALIDRHHLNPVNEKAVHRPIHAVRTPDIDLFGKLLSLIVIDPPVGVLGRPISRVSDVAP